MCYFAIKLDSEQFQVALKYLEKLVNNLEALLHWGRVRGLTDVLVQWLSERFTSIMWAHKYSGAETKQQPHYR